MSSNPFERLARSFTFRLSFGYAALFTLSAVILFGLLYLLLASTLQRKDREVIEARPVSYTHLTLPTKRIV